MELTAGKAAFVAAALDRNADLLEVGCGVGQTTDALRAAGRKVVTVDLDASQHPDVVADARALPFAVQFDAVCTDTMINQLGSTLRPALAEMTRLTRHVVIREWLPADGRGTRDTYLNAMLTARHRDGDDYLLHDPQQVAVLLRGLGWASEISIYEEPADIDPPVLYPLDQARHAQFIPAASLTGPGVASSWVLVARPIS